MTPDRIGVFTAALFAPGNLKILGILLAVALFAPGVPGWLMAKIAALVYTIKVFKTAADPEFARMALAEAEYVRGEIHERPQPASLGQGTALRGKYLELRQRANTALADMGRQIDSVSDSFLKSQLGGVRPQLQAMVARLETLCASAQDLATRGSDDARSVAEIAALEAKAKATQDPQTQEHYRTAIEAKRKVMENALWIRKTATRMEAELESLDGAIDRMRSDVSRLVASSLAGGSGNDAQQDISGLANQMAAIEATVHELETLKAEDRRTASKARVS